MKVLFLNSRLLLTFCFLLTFPVKSTAILEFLTNFLTNITNSSELFKSLNSVFKGINVLPNGTLKFLIDFQIPGSKYIIYETLNDLLDLEKPKKIKFKSFKKPFKSGFNEQFVQKQIYSLCGASYADDAAFCLKNAYPLVKVKRVLQKKCDNPFSTCAVVLAVSHEEQIIYLAFRGTDTTLQLISEVQSVLWNKLDDAPIGGKVAAYFKKKFDLFWSTIKKDLEELIKENKDYELMVTGHSLGGAMAIIAASQILKDKLIDAKKLFVVTLGQPRVGNTDFIKKYDELLANNTYRVINKRDIVPHVPPLFFNNYKHSKNEIWYENSINKPFKYCKIGDSLNCSESNLFLSVLNHVKYFERSFTSFLKQNCTFD